MGYNIGTKYQNKKKILQKAWMKKLQDC